MAKGKVKKGFASYLLVLLLAIVATFLILITAMLFSPFKNILGFQYFKYNEEELVFAATGDREDQYFNYETIEQINVDCGYANVKVERIFTQDKYGVKFEKYLSGFARSDQNTDFTYEVSYTDYSKKELNVKVHEPEGFLYFSKTLTISIFVPVEKEYNLSNTAINIANTTGNIYIGNNEKVFHNADLSARNYLQPKLHKVLWVWFL